MTNDMTKGNPLKIFIYFTIPLLIGNIFQQLYSMVDTIIVGRFVGVNALAALGACNSLFFLVNGLVLGLTSGFAVLVAQKFGAKDEKGVKKAVENVEKIIAKELEGKNVYEQNKIDERLIRGNVIANEDYFIAMNQKGEGASKYKNILINRFKSTDDYPQGIFFDIKNIKSKKIWSSNYSPNNGKYQISFMPDKMEQEMINDNIKTKIETIIAPDEPVEIRKLSLENLGNEDEILEVTSHFEPVLSPKEQDYAHPAFNNLFLMFDFDHETNSIIVKRRKRTENEQEMYMAVNLSTNSETIGDLEYEIDAEKFTGRGNIGIPQMVKNSSPFSKKIGLVTEPVVALKRTMKTKKQEKTEINLIIAVGETKEKVIENIKKYSVEENIKKAFELSKAKNEAQTRYLRIKGSQIRDYQKILSYIIFNNPSKKINLEKLPKEKYSQSELWKYGISGDLPIITVTIKYINDDGDTSLYPI